MAAAEEVRIRRIRVRGPEGARAQAARALEQAPWPARPGGEVLILRRLELAAAPEDLGAAAARQAEALASRAVDGWSPAAADAPAVRFASRAELLGCLLRDLLAGRAERLWFWAGWRDLFGLEPAAAAARALGREPLEVAAALAALGRDLTAWRRFWTGLPEPETRRLLMSVQRDTAWPVAEPWTEFAAAPRAGHEQLTPVFPDTLPPLPVRFPDPEAPTVRLAALLLAWTTSPHRLAAPGAAAWLGVLARRLSGSEAPQTTPPPPAGVQPPGTAKPPPPAAAPQGPAPAPPGSSSSRPGHPAVPDAEADRAAAGRRGRRPTGNEPTPPAGERAGPAPRPGTGAPGGRPSTIPPSVEQPLATQPGAYPGEAPESGAEHPAPFPDSTWQFVTPQGGLFLLLNFLRIGAVQRHLLADQQPLAGWRWLLAVSRRLGLEPDPPLARFLAAQLALDDPGELNRLPPLAREQALDRLGRRRFGAALWNPNLLRLDALVRADRSHLDIHCRMANLRLEVRRAGLDVDPGWLPWLARVVRFHYDDPPELGPGP